MAPTTRHEERRREHRYGRIAQLVEQLTLNQRVLGSSPSASTISQENPQHITARTTLAVRILAG